MSSNALDAREQEHVVHLEDSRMRLREGAELVVQGSVAVTVLSAVMDDYARHFVSGFTVLNAVVGTALVIGIARGARAMIRHHDVAATGVNVIGAIGGLAAIIEGVHKLQGAGFNPHGRHFPIGITIVFTGVLNIYLALNMARREASRALRISRTGISMRLSRFRRFNVGWENLRELRVEAGAARLVCADGSSRVVPLSKLVNADEVRNVLKAAFEVRGMRVTGSASPAFPH